MFRNFEVGFHGEFVSYSYIYFSFFDCEVKLLFHVIKCHSYMFVHAWLAPSIPLPPLHQTVYLRTLSIPFYNNYKGWVRGGERGGGWKAIHKLTLSINKPKNLSNEFKLSEKKLNINIFGWQAPSGLLFTSSFRPFQCKWKISIAKNLSLPLC